MYLLDTNVISELRRPDRANAAVLAWASKAAAVPTFLSAITILEIEIGLRRLQRRDPAQAEPLRLWFEADVMAEYGERILPVDLAVARHAAALHVPDRRPENDALIAATALAHGLTLVTRNTADFAPMGVPLLNPWDQV
ncbi:MAG: type II toxin-antitoxin system VapC family toxin [Sphingomonas sp.]